MKTRAIKVTSWANLVAIECLSRGGLENLVVYCVVRLRLLVLCVYCPMVVRLANGEISL